MQVAEKLPCPYGDSLESKHVQVLSACVTEPLGSSRTETAPGGNASLFVLLLENAFKFLPKQEIVTCKKFI